MSNHPNRAPWKARALAAADRFLCEPALQLLPKGIREGLREAFLKGFEEGRTDAKGPPGKRTPDT